MTTAAVNKKYHSKKIELLKTVNKLSIAIKLCEKYEYSELMKKLLTVKKKTEMKVKTLK